MRLGIFAKTFRCSSLGAALDAVVASNVTAIQFNLSLTGLAPLPQEIPDGLPELVRSSVRRRGLEMAAVSGTYNMAHPDPSARSEGFRALTRLLAAAPAMGTRVVTLCTGSRDSADMWHWHPDNRTRRAWADMEASVAAAVAVAVEHDVILAFEPERNNVVCDAPAARRLVRDIASPNLKVVIDPANLIEPGELDRQVTTLERAFDLLADDLILAHAKDVLDDGTVVAAGRGGLDYARYVALLRQVGYDGALILHGLAEDEVTTSVAFLSAHLDRAAAEAV